jgi:hypothetical protein
MLLRRGYHTNRKQNVSVNALLTRCDDQCDIRFTGDIVEVEALSSEFWFAKNKSPLRDI